MMKSNNFEYRNYVCPNCHRTLSIQQSSLRCPLCTLTFPIEDSIPDFALNNYYDEYDPSIQLSSEHLAGLEHEVEGSRWRINAFYFPKIDEAIKKNRLNLMEVRVLDCGCGNGLSVDLLNDLGINTWGVDLSKLRRWQWRERQYKARLSLADASRLPFPEAFFNFILCSGVIEHIGVQEYKLSSYIIRPLENRDELRIAFLAELMRVLSPQGRLWLDCPNGSFPIDFWHGEKVGQARRHSLNEHFLAKKAEVQNYLCKVGIRTTIKARSPHRMFRFQQVGHHWYGSLARPLMRIYLYLLQFYPFSLLSGTALNPYLVLEICKEVNYEDSSHH